MTTCFHCGRVGATSLCDRCKPIDPAKTADRIEADRVYALRVQLEARQARMAR